MLHNFLVILQKNNISPYDIISVLNIRIMVYLV